MWGRVDGSLIWFCKVFISGILAEVIRVELVLNPLSGGLERGLGLRLGLCIHEWYVQFMYPCMLSGMFACLLVATYYKT